MIERQVDIPTADGAMNSFIVHPEEDGPFPVVLFYMDAPGKREELHDMARRLAAVGYYVVLPNLYYRHSRDYSLQERTEPALAEMFALMDSLDAATAECDTLAMLAFVDGESEADATRIGAVGYCMSGPFVMWAAAAYPDRLRCIASIHGARMVTDQPDSPHKMAPKIRCDSYFACAEFDKWATRPDMLTLQNELEAARVPFKLEWYPGAEHGFVFPNRAGVYKRSAAERHWEQLFKLFERNLRRAA